MSRQRLSRYILKCPLPTLRFRLSISYVIRYVFGRFVYSARGDRRSAIGQRQR